MLDTVVGDPLVDLIRKEQETVALDNGRHCLNHLACEDGTGRIVWLVQHEHTRPFRDVPLKIRWIELVSILLA